jgi:hypothetical protein
VVLMGVAYVIDQLPRGGVEVSGVGGAAADGEAAGDGQRRISGDCVVGVHAQRRRIEERIDHAQVDDAVCRKAKGVDQVRVRL